MYKKSLANAIPGLAGGKPARIAILLSVFAKAAKESTLAGMWTTRLTIWGLLVTILFGLGLLFGLFLPRLLSFKSQPQALNTSTLLTQVQTLSQLVTVKYVMEKVVVLEDVSESTLGKMFSGQSRVLLLAHGVVKAGVDLQQLAAGDLRVEDKKIVLALPPSQITDAFLDEQKTQVIDHTTGLLRAFDKNLEQTARRNAVDDLRRAARNGGILKEADERAREQLTGFFRQLKFEQVEFRSR